MADDLLDKIIQAHGGLERWSRVKSIDLTFNLSGHFLGVKGYPGHYQPTITIDATKPKTVMQRLTSDDPDVKGILEYDKTWFESRDGSVLEESKESRITFKDHKRDTPWNDLQLTYFISYALWNYLTIPFIFVQPGFSTQELEPHTEIGETWRVLEVTYPDGYPTHTKIQRFYFDDKEYFLRRMDYTTDVAKGVAAHYCWDHKTIDGLVFPTLRRVIRRDGNVAYLNNPSAFIIDYVKVKVNDK